MSFNNSQKISYKIIFNDYLHIYQQLVLKKLRTTGMCEISADKRRGVRQNLTL